MRITRKGFDNHMAKLIDKTSYFGSCNNIYNIDENLFSGNCIEHLKICYYLCQHPDIKITDIIIESVDEQTGYDIAWQSCIRYDYLDFKETFSKFDYLITQHNKQDFSAWCVIFKQDEQEYTISGTLNSTDILLHNSQEIDDKMIELINWIETRLAVEKTNDVREEKVNEIKDSINNDEYSVNAEDSAKKILN